MNRVSLISAQLKANILASSPFRRVRQNIDDLIAQ